MCYREKRLAKKYYDKLFKEYCIADLSRYKENKVHFIIVNRLGFNVCPFVKLPYHCGYVVKPGS